MEIRWLGNSTFEVRSSVGAVIVDHQGPSPKGSQIEDENTIFAFSKEPDANFKTKYQILSGPGEYEIGGLSVRGVATPGSDPAISREINTVYVIEADGLHVVTLGNPGHTFSAQAVEQISNVDVLMIDTELQNLEPDELSSIVRNLEPKMIVPSGYDSEKGKPSAQMSRLLTELGVKEFEPISKLTVSRTGLPDERTVVVLEKRPA